MFNGIMSEELGQRLKQARARRAIQLGRKVTQSDLAKMCGWQNGQTRIANYESGARTPSNEDMRLLAKHLATTASWLAFGTELEGDFPSPHQRLLRESPMDYNVEDGPEFQSSIPLISWVQAGQFADVSDPYEVGDYEKMVPTTRWTSENAFALRVQGDSMQAPEGLSIPEGFIVHVDPGRQWTNGDIVVAKLVDEQSATLKKLVMDGDRMFLKPLNPRYPIIEVTGECIIVGVVVHIGLDL